MIYNRRVSDLINQQHTDHRSTEMTLSTKITVIGAGSASFGENTLSAIMRSKKLRGSTLALVDRNADSLAIVSRLANRLNREWDAQFTILSYTNHQEALPGSKF